MLRLFKIIVCFSFLVTHLCSSSLTYALDAVHDLPEIYPSSSLEPHSATDPVGNLDDISPPLEVQSNQGDESSPEEQATAAILDFLPPEMLKAIAEHLNDNHDLASLVTTCMDLNESVRDVLIQNKPMTESLSFVAEKEADYEFLGELAKHNKFDEMSITLVNPRDEDLQHVKDFRYIGIANANRITDAGLAYLSKAITLKLIHCSHITDSGLAHLQKVRRLTIDGSPSRECSDYTPFNFNKADSEKRKVIFIENCKNITDQDLAFFSDANSVTMRDCPNITDAGLVHLRNVDTLCLYGNCGRDNITGSFLAHLPKLYWFHIDPGAALTDAALEHLGARSTSCSGRSVAMIYNNNQITDAAIKKARRRGCTVSRTRPQAQETFADIIVSSARSALSYAFYYAGP